MGLLVVIAHYGDRTPGLRSGCQKSLFDSLKTPCFSRSDAAQKTPLRGPKACNTGILAAIYPIRGGLCPLELPLHYSSIPLFFDKFACCAVSGSCGRVILSGGAAERDEALTTFTDGLWLDSIDQVTVHPDGTLTFRFQDGTALLI